MEVREIIIQELEKNADVTAAEVAKVASKLSPAIDPLKVKAQFYYYKKRMKDSYEMVEDEVEETEKVEEDENEIECYEMVEEILTTEMPVSRKVAMLKGFFGIE